MQDLPVCVCGVSPTAIAIGESGLATVDNASRRTALVESIASSNRPTVDSNASSCSAVRRVPSRGYRPFSANGGGSRAQNGLQ